MSGLVFLVTVAASGAAVPSPVAELERGHSAFLAGQYREAARLLDGLPARLAHSGDYALYFAAESEFYSGAFGRAQVLFETLGRMRSSRFGAVAPWRAADCRWAQGRRQEAVAAYRRLGAPRTAPAGVDPVVSRFRIAELAPPGEQPRLFREIHAGFPAHPLAEQAARRGGAPATAGEGQTPPAEPDPRTLLQRAALFAEGKHYDEALAELDRLPAQLPLALALERDFQLGMAKYHMRRDYPRAGRLLLGIAGHLTGEKAAFAQFHGARALSRADIDDEAIVEYRKVVDRYPTSSWAAEAQFRLGWVDFNRGRYREALPGLHAAVTRFGRSPFARDAAWCMFFAHYLLDEAAQALPALEQYARLASSDPAAVSRVCYWRARTVARLGRPDEARALLRECLRRWPLTYYGTLARSRLRGEGENPPPPLPRADRPVLRVPDQAVVERDPAIQRADELEHAGLAVDAGFELERGEEGLHRRLGREAALAVLLDRYPRLQAFNRAYRLAETRGAAALALAPVGDARVVWEAAYPRAFADLVERHGAGNPDFFLYTIMRKESAFAPGETSYADARGLLQVIADRGRDMAIQLGEPFHPDELFDPATNIRLGARYIGSLVRAFAGQLFLAAAAYNGGEKATMRWCDQFGRRPLDEFVELIAYEQTREYVKRVIGIYAHYVLLYRGQPYELPLVVDPRHGKEPP
jgi:soluble lytic murein transglycosylase